MHLNPEREKSMANCLRLLLFTALLLLLTGCSSRDIPLPQSIGSLRLEHLQSGEEARREIDRLHGKQISYQRGYVGTYVAENGSAKLWVSEHSSPGEAAEAIGKMAQSMKQGRQQVFWHFQEILIKGLRVYFVVGMGQAHYFFQRGTKVAWLAVDPPLAEDAIRDAIEKIPQYP